MKKDSAQRFNVIDKFSTKATELKSLLELIREQGYSAPHVK